MWLLTGLQPVTQSPLGLMIEEGMLGAPRVPREKVSLKRLVRCWLPCGKTPPGVLLVSGVFLRIRDAFRRLGLRGIVSRPSKPRVVNN